MRPFDINSYNYHVGHLFMDTMRSRPNAICQYTFVSLSEQIRDHFKISTPKLAFCQKEHLQDLKQVVKQLGLTTKIICFDAVDYSLKRFIQEYDDGDTDEKGFEPLIFDLDKVYVGLVVTGGTMGIMKLAAYKHRTFIAKILELKRCPLYQRDPAETYNSETKPWLLVTQAGWVSAFLRTMLLPVLQYTKLMTSHPRTTEHIIYMINKYRLSTTVVRIGFLKAIFNCEKHCDMTCFDSIIISGDRVPKAFHLELRKKMRPDAVECEGYGQTENLGPMLLVNPEGPVGNCGNRPYKGQQVKLMDPDTVKEIKEPNVMKDVCFTEYYRKPEITAPVFTEDHWYRTGDLLYRDQDGNFFFVERLKRVIKCRNKLILPVELETVIRTLPGIKECVVVTIPHEEDGKHPLACVVKKQNSDVTAQQIKDLVDSKLPESHKLRGGVVFLDEIPYTMAGKVCRYQLTKIILVSDIE